MKITNNVLIIGLSVSVAFSQCIHDTNYQKSFDCVSITDGYQQLRFLLPLPEGIAIRRVCLLVCSLVCSLVRIWPPAAMAGRRQAGGHRCDAWRRWRPLRALFLVAKLMPQKCFAFKA